MNKKKNSLIFLSFVVAAVLSRVLYFTLGGGQVVDTYGYFAHAMIRLERSAPSLNSGLSYIFTQNLSVLLLFVGNIIKMAGYCQMLIQIIWLIFFYLGISMLFGSAAGSAASCILVISPWILKSVFLISPENYYMLYVSLFLFILGYFHGQVKKYKWNKSIWNVVYLIITGIFLGILCMWHFGGWLLPGLLVYVQLRNFLILKGVPEEEKGLMGAGMQTCSLLAGMALGISVVLFAYTGLTGLTISQQFGWWLAQMKDFEGRYQEVSGLLIMWLVIAIGAGIFFQWACAKASAPDMEEEIPMEEAKENYVVTEDNRKVKLLDNPLPVPKKHVRREIDFDINDVRPDFDYPVSENDDFDI